MMRSNSSLSLPFPDLSLPLTRRFVERDVLVSLYEDQLGSEGFLCEREGRVTLHTGDTFVIEPCNNWAFCHVWKEFHSSSFLDETNFPATDFQVKNVRRQC